MGTSVILQDSRRNGAVFQILQWTIIKATILNISSTFELGECLAEPALSKSHFLSIPERRGFNSPPVQEKFISWPRRKGLAGSCRRSGSCRIYEIRAKTAFNVQGFKVRASRILGFEGLDSGKKDLHFVQDRR